MAFARGESIFLSAPYVRSHPDDFGMVVHELVHVVQGYPPKPVAWVNEGLADYVRYYVVEPDSPRRHFDPNSDTYKRGYQPAAAFLNWIRVEKDSRVIVDLDRTMRNRAYNAAFWRYRFGRSADDLWDEFIASQ